MNGHLIPTLPVRERTFFFPPSQTMLLVSAVMAVTVLSGCGKKEAAPVEVVSSKPVAAEFGISGREPNFQGTKRQLENLRTRLDADKPGIQRVRLDERVVLLREELHGDFLLIHARVPVEEFGGIGGKLTVDRCVLQSNGTNYFPVLLSTGFYEATQDDLGKTTQLRQYKFHNQSLSITQSPGEVTVKTIRLERTIKQPGASLFGWAADDEIYHTDNFASFINVFMLFENPKDRATLQIGNRPKVPIDVGVRAAPTEVVEKDKPKGEQVASVVPTPRTPEEKHEPKAEEKEANPPKPQPKQQKSTPVPERVVAENRDATSEPAPPKTVATVEVRQAEPEQPPAPTKQMAKLEEQPVPPQEPEEFPVPIEPNSQGILFAFTENKQPVNGIAISPDNTLVASAGDDKTVRVWNLKTGKLVRTIEEHPSSVTSISFLPDSEQILTKCGDNTVRQWDLTEGKLKRQLSGHQPQITGFAASPDGSKMAFGDDKGLIVVWDLELGQRLHRLDGHDRIVRSVCFAKDGQRLVSGSSDRSVKMWDLQEGKILRTYEGHTERVTATAISPNGRLIASGSSDQTIRIWDAEGGEEFRRFQKHRAAIEQLLFTPDGRELFSAGQDSLIMHWDLVKGEFVRDFREHTNGVNCMAMSNDGKLIASGGNDGVIFVWVTSLGDKD